MKFLARVLRHEGRPCWLAGEGFSCPLLVKSDLTTLYSIYGGEKKQNIENNGHKAQVCIRGLEQDNTKTYILPPIV